jgi:hypothetical protein
MGRNRLPIALAVLAAGAAIAALIAGPVGAAEVRVGTLVLRADGGFTPRVLPRRSYAPIEFEGHGDVKTTDGSVPPAVRQAKLDFDHDGRLVTAGLATCPPSRITGATPKQARRRCRAAIVGSGHVSAAIKLPGQLRVNGTEPLSLFNGPRQGGNPTVVAHTRTTYPTTRTYVVVVPIEKRRGTYGYRANVTVPEIAGGYGALTHVDAKIGRRFRSHGSERSYVSARCSDYIFQTRGHFSFSDGTIISGVVYKTCRPRS